MDEKFNDLVMVVHEFAKKTGKPFYACMFNDEHFCCSGRNINGNDIVAGCVAALFENLKDNKNKPSSITKTLIISALSEKYCNDGGFSREDVKDLHKVIDLCTEGKI